MKIFKKMEERNKIEKETGKASYKTLIDTYVNNLILCNNIKDDDTFIFEDLQKTICKVFPYNEEEQEDIEIFQYYLTDLDSVSADTLTKAGELVVYNNSLNLYVLCVTHYGSSWQDIITNIELMQ